MWIALPSPLRLVWCAAFLGRSKYVIKFFSARPTNDVSYELSFRLDFDVVLASVLVDIAILGCCRALIRDCSHDKERSDEMAD